MKSHVSKPTPLAIVGIGCIFPKSENLDEFWSNIRNKVDAISDVPETHWNVDDYYSEDKKARDKTYGKKGGFLSAIDFDPMEFKIAPNALEAIDATQLLGLVAAKRALEDAGYDRGDWFDRDRTSVILGVTGTLELVIPLGARLGYPKWRRAMEDAGIDKDEMKRALAYMSDSYVDWQESSFPGLLGNVVAGRITNQFDLGGSNCVVDAACASSFSAIHMAAMELQTGQADAVITGGADTFNDIFMYMCFSKTPALSPSGHARPFDAKTDGTTLGEGLGLVVVRRLDDAVRDGNRVYAVIRSVGGASDGSGAAVFAPQNSGQTRAMWKAYKQVDVSPKTIDLLEAHGTGTKVGDDVEIKSIHQVFEKAGDEKSWCALGSIKSQIGHTKAAAGAAGLIKTAMALYHKVLPPTLKVETPPESLLPYKSPFYVNTEQRPWVKRKDHPRRAGVSAFGFGGSNYHCLLEEFEPEKKLIDWDNRVQLLAFSDESIDGLKNKVGAFDISEKWSDFCKNAYLSRVEFDRNQTHRLVMVAERDFTDVGKTVSSALSMLDKKNDKAWSLPPGIFYGSGDVPGKVGVVFPGQGCQYPGMLRDLACQFPESHAVMDAANEIFEENKDQDLSRRLVDYVYPIPEFDDEGRRRNEIELRDTRVAQPALGAVSLGAYRAMKNFGLNPDALAGHSYGELTALCAGGRLKDEEFYAVSALRGRLMAAGKGDKGAMLAVQADIETVEKIVNENKIDLVLANKNAPDQVVLSGRTEEVDRAGTIFKDKGVRCKKLEVSAAFHSPLVSDARKPFEEWLKGVKFPKGSCVVYSNTTGEEYPQTADKARAVLAGQLAKPVEFVKEINSIYDAGVRTFVEIGPGARMTSLVKAILKEKPDVFAFSIDPSRGSKNGIADMAGALGNLAALGYEVDLKKWDPVEMQEKAKRKPKFTVPVCGANYMKPRPERPKFEKKPKAPALQPQNGTAPSAVFGDAYAEMMRITQQNMQALQRIQEQTALIHQQFLQGQESAIQTFQSMVASQQQALAGGTPQVQPVRVSMPETPQLSVYQPSPQVTPAMPQPTPQVRTPDVEKAAPSKPSVDVSGVLLELVSEKTGYPAEMLEMDMALDSDLGIDSIKRVEIFSGLKDRIPGVQPVKAEQMGALKTLSDIAGYLAENIPESAPAETLVEPAGGVSRDDASKVLLELVAEKTGYPAEMLEMEMALDSDLGIDSIKRVEIFSGLKDRIPNVQPVKAEQMGALKTLGDITDFLVKSAKPGVTAPATAAPSSGLDRDRAAEVLLELVAEKTGYPAEMLEMDMALDSDLGIDSIKRVEIFSGLKDRIPGVQPVKAEQMGALKTLGAIVGYLVESSAGQVKPAEKAEKSAPEATCDVCAVCEKKADVDFTRSLDQFIPAPVKYSGGKPRSVKIPGGSKVLINNENAGLAGKAADVFKAMGYEPETVSLSDVEGLKVPDVLGALIINAPDGADDDFVKSAFKLIKKCENPLKASADRGGASLVTVTFMDGKFGLSDIGRADPVQGALAGLCKTAGLEWLKINCRALDISPDVNEDRAVDFIVGGAFVQGPPEMGCIGDDEFTIENREAPIDESTGDLPVKNGDVVVVTGGARGVTAECVISLACRIEGLKLLLLGRSPAPMEEPDWLKNLKCEAEIKRAIMNRAKDEGRKVAPADVEKEYKRVSANREMLNTFRRIMDAGGEPVYRSVDVRDVNALSLVINEEAGDSPIRGLIHGAGVINDKLICDKTAGEFNKVYSTKVEGLRNLLKALKERDLAFMALFSSTTARVGRKGQIDYAAANEVLNKIAQRQAKERPGCRVVSFNWGPWDGGMVTPELKKLFISEGVGIIPINAGAEFLVNEISRKDGPVEIMVMGSRKGEEPSKAPVVDTGDMTVAFERKLSIKDHPFLKSHVLDGRAVLPASVIIEWLAHGAIHGNPGLKFHGFENFSVLKGVKLNPAEQLTVRVYAGKARKRDGVFVIPVEMRSTGLGGAFSRSSRADIILVNRLPSGSPDMTDIKLENYHNTPKEAYDKLLFHGEDLHGIRKVMGISRKGIEMTVDPAPKPSKWMNRPLRSRWIADPMVIDCTFQAMILWSFENLNAGSLPTNVGSFRQYKPFPKGESLVRIRVNRHDNSKAEADVEILDDRGSLVGRMKNYESVIDESLNKVFRKNKLPQEALL